MVAILTYAIGVPGGLARWYQGEVAPGAADLAAGAVALPYQPAGGVPLPALFIGADGKSFATMTAAATAQALRLNEVREERLTAARAYRDTRKAAGFDAPAFGRVSTESQQSILRINSALAAAAAAMAAKKAMPMTDFPLVDGTKVSLTPTKAVSMGLGVMGMLDACDQAFSAIEAQIAAATAPASVDITAGYPG